MGCLAPCRVWFYLLYPCSNNPCNSFNCFFLHFKRNQTNCYELYLSSRFYRIYTFNDICILHVVLIKATPDRHSKSVGVSLCFLRIKFCVPVGETCGLPRANTVRPYRVLGISPLTVHAVGFRFLFFKTIDKYVKSVYNIYIIEE